MNDDEGVDWLGDGGNYRTKGGYIEAAKLEQIERGRIAADFQAPATVAACAQEMRAVQEEVSVPGD